MKGRAANLLRWMRRSRAPQALVLLYHRVAEVRPDPWSLCVSPRNFSEQMAVVRQGFCPLALRDLVAALRTGQIPPRAVVVTFDDGYADNLLAARPVLEAHHIPGTVFVATGALDAGEFWWDELEGILLPPGVLPPTLELCIAGAEWRWELGPSASYSPDAAAAASGWIAWGEWHPTARHSLYRELWELLLPLAEPERQRVMEQLRSWAGSGRLARESHRTLRSAELERLACDELVEIGAHSVTHAALAALPPMAQRDEIAQSKVCLENLLAHPVTSFSYPFGRRTDYTSETMELVREAGFNCACSNFVGMAGCDARLFELPRFNVPDVDGEAFERQLVAWFDS